MKPHVVVCALPGQSKVSRSKGTRRDGERARRGEPKKLLRNFPTCGNEITSENTICDVKRPATQPCAKDFDANFLK